MRKLLPCVAKNHPDFYRWKRLACPRRTPTAVHGPNGGCTGQGTVNKPGQCHHSHHVRPRSSSQSISEMCRCCKHINLVFHVWLDVPSPNSFYHLHESDEFQMMLVPTPSLRAGTEQHVEKGPHNHFDLHEGIMHIRSKLEKFYISGKYAGFIFTSKSLSCTGVEELPRLEITFFRTCCLLLPYSPHDCTQSNSTQPYVSLL